MRRRVTANLSFDSAQELLATPRSVHGSVALWNNPCGTASTRLRALPVARLDGPTQRNVAGEPIWRVRGERIALFRRKLLIVPIATKFGKGGLLAQ